MVRSAMVSLVILLSVLAPIPEVRAAIPEPDAVVYGDGTNPLLPGDIVQARRGTEILASSVVGSVPQAAAFYVLRVHLETPTSGSDPRTTGVARVGDAISFFLNGADTSTSLVINARGMIQSLDIPVDPDRDGDGIPAISDNCPLVANPSQADGDSDGLGDVCDPCTDVDTDGFGYPILANNTCTLDNCPLAPNPSQRDQNANGVGDACESSPFIVVSSDPSDQPDYPTVGEGLTAVRSAGTTIQILAGYGPYPEHVVLNAGTLVRLLGVPESPAVLTGNGSGPTVDIVAVSGQTPVVLQNLIINGADGVRTVRSTRIVDCTFGTIAGTAISLNSGDHHLEGVRVTSGTTGIDQAAGITTVVERSSFDGLVTALNVNGTLEADSSLISHSLRGATVSATGDFRMHYSTVADNTVAGVDNLGGQVLVMHSILWNNTADLAGVACGAVYQSDLTLPTCSGVNGNLSINPALKPDYHLLPSSPLLDLIQPGSFPGTPCNDLSGGPRLRDYNLDGLAASDLGAYEEAPVSAAPAVVNVRWDDADTVTWDPIASAASYHAYRGDLDELSYSGYGQCRDDTDGDLTDTLLVDTDVPASGHGFFYLFLMEDGSGVDGTSGNGTCAERSRFEVCGGAQAPSEPPRSLDALDARGALP